MPRLAFALLLLSAPTASAAGPIRAFKAPGTYRDARSTCSARISTSPMGGFARLHLRGQKERSIDDVTGAVFSGSGTLVYSVSPIYGRPGLFSYDCATARVRSLVLPKTLDRADPHGADYFELVAVNGDRAYYHYAPDVDGADFKNLHAADHLLTVELDGSGNRRATAEEWGALSR